MVEPFRAASPDNLTELLAHHNLMTCTLDDCYPSHPLIPSLLQAYVPPPPGVDPKDFYGAEAAGQGSKTRKMRQHVVFEYDVD